jgi:Putative Ig domain
MKRSLIVLTAVVLGLSQTSRVLAQNDPPVITSSPPSESVGSYSYQVTAFDPNGDAIAFSLTEGPAGMTIDPLTGLIQWQPGPADVGITYDVVIQVIDFFGAVATQSYYIVVLQEANRAPRFVTIPVVDE